MQTPVEIAFRYCEPSDEIRSEIAAQVQRLEKFSARITSCRVVVAPPHHGRPGNEGEGRSARTQAADGKGGRAARRDVRLISKYNLLAIPVVDDAEHVIGIVTVDDAVDTLVARQDAEMQQFGGVAPLEAPYMSIGFLAMIKKRAGWLCALFLAEMLTASAMQTYEDALQKAVVLALFIPLIMSSGGNSGGQAIAGVE